MRFSYVMLPDYPLDDCIEYIKTADELGFYACYSVDETWHKDLWVLFAAAARETKQIRFGPNVTHVFLREPTLICQQMATLDELTGGRTEIVVSTGNFGLLSQYKIDWEGRKPLSRLKEAMHVMRTFLDEGAITFDGDFFQYAGLYTFARPVQDRIPIKMGAMKGPRSFAGRGRAGRRHAPGAGLQPRGLRLLLRAPADRRREGRPRRRRPRQRRLGRDGRQRGQRRGQAGRPHPRRVLHLLDATRAARPPRHRCLRAGTGGRGARRAATSRRPSRSSSRTTPRSSASPGTPEEVVEKIKTDLEPAGVNHMIFSLADPALVKLFSGEDVPNVPDINGQLKLVAERVMPAFG